MTTAGCDFFGKKTDEQGYQAPGTLSSGQSIIGSYSFTSSSVAENRDPATATTITYSFDPNGSARVELRDPHYGGTECTGYGQFRTTGTEVFIYIQAISSGHCNFGSPIHLSNVEVKSQSIQYTDPADQQRYTLFLKRYLPITAPVGIWDFKGEGGIDYLLFDQNGYFIMQYTEEKETYLLLGYYKILGARMELYLFSNMDPSQATAPIVFTNFITDGIRLQLIDNAEEDEEKELVYEGTRL